MLDAWAKWPSGIIYGHRMEMGSFQECLDIHTPFNGKYCQAQIPSGTTTIDVSVEIQLGICIPSKCNSEEFDVLLKEFLVNSYNLNLNASTNLVIASTCTTGEHVEFQPLDWAAM